MSELPSTARVVIIGGGAVGASSLYHLAKAGWTDCLLLEKNELTAGSTWHAAGNVPTFSSSWSIMNMQRYSASLYRELGALVDYPMNYHVTGSIRLGHSKERLQEFKRVVGMGRYQGMDLDILTPDEMRGKYPFLETHDLTGALYDPYDGDIDPAQLTQALAKGARDMGAKIFRFCPATGARREGEEWVISTPQGEIRCEKVVNAAGYYAREVGRWFGRDVPMMVMSHQYILFEEIPELAAWSKEAGHKLPLLRDVDSSYYLRQEKTGMNLGPYERNCKAHWVTPDVDPRRFDTYFFLAVEPEAQDASHCGRETSLGTWMRPADAIARGLAGEIALPPPTWTTLRQLEVHSTLEAALDWARNVRIVRVMPGFEKGERESMLTLPGDPLYPTIDGWIVPEETRFILEEGKGWLPTRP